MNRPDRTNNPFFEHWTTPDGVPPFARIRPEHFAPAYARAFAEHDAEIEAVAARPEPPDFANTIVALELSGRALMRVELVFGLLVGAESNDALLAIERDIAPQVASHWNKFRTNAALFGRIDTLMREATTLGLSAEQERVLERYHTSFRRAGAALDGTAKARLAEIVKRLAELGTAFSQNVLADEQVFKLPLHGEAELAGLPDFVRETMKSDAMERGLDGCVVTLSRSSAEPFLQFAQRRDLREKLYRASFRAATMAVRPTISRSSPRWCGFAPSAPACWAIPTSRITGSMTRWRKHRRQCASCSAPCGRGRAPAPRPIATLCRRWCRRKAATSRSRRGTGATTPKSCVNSAATSTRLPSRRTSISSE